MIILLTFLYPQSLLFAILCISKRHLKVPAKTDRKKAKEREYSWVNHMCTVQVDQDEICFFLVHGYPMCTAHVDQDEIWSFWFMVTIYAQYILTRTKSDLFCFETNRVFIQLQFHV